MRVVGSVLALASAAIVAQTPSPKPTPVGVNAPERAADANTRMVCKRFPRTGSLIGSYRECKTVWEWARERDALRQSGVVDGCRNRAEGGFC